MLRWIRKLFKKPATGEISVHKKKPKSPLKIKDNDIDFDNTNFSAQKRTKKSTKNHARKSKPGAHKRRGRPKGPAKERRAVYVQKGLWERYEKWCYALDYTVSYGIERHIKAVLGLLDDKKRQREQIEIERAIMKAQKT